MTARKIIHVDMDAFYASVEQRDRPELRGKPVIVGGSPQSRGVVCTASYEARVFGVRSAMSCAQAGRRCPHGIFIPPNFTKYRAVSQAIHRIFADYVSSRDRIEPLSLDEAYLDVSDNVAQLGSATETAQEIRRRVWEDCQLTISAGVSSNKLIAKLASDENKPDGLCVVPPHKIKDFLAGRPLRQLPGIGPKTNQRLERANFYTVDDLLAADPESVARCLGSQAERYLRFAQGIDHRPVRRRSRAKQVSVERTFSQDIAQAEELFERLGKMGDICWQRLCRSLPDEPPAETPPEDRIGKTLTVKIKYADFSLQTRSKSSETGITSLQQLQQMARDCLEPMLERQPRIRLLGVGVSNWLETEEPDASKPGLQTRLSFSQETA